MSSPFKNPELMVIGDSLAQGCRSLSVARHLCDQSYSSILAAAQGWKFNTPPFARPVLFDLEELTRKYLHWGILVGWPLLYKRLQENLNEWIEHFTERKGAELEWCDNLAVAGANLEELGADPKRSNHFSWAKSLPVVQSFRDTSVKDLVLKRKSELGGLHLAINSGFVLNPKGLAKYANWTPLDWVEARQPKRLLVHMGHNNGLYSIGSNAVKVNLEALTLPPYLRMIDAIMAVTSVKQQVIFVLLPKISAVANLEILGEERDAHGYGPRYQPVFSTSASEFSGADMREIDLEITRINRAARDHLRKYQDSHWVEVVEAYEMLEANDFKQTLDRARQTYIGNYAINNRYLRGSGKTLRSGGGGRSTPSGVKWRFDEGGFQSMDGMHPTAVGYGEFAIEIGKRLNLSYDKTEIRKDALKNEKLITQYPAGHQTILSAMKFLRGRPKKTESFEPEVQEDNRDNNAVHLVLAAQRACGRV